MGGLSAAIPATSAGAAGTTLLTESFMNSTTANSGWQMPTGSEGVCLTAGTNTSATPVPDCDTSPVANGSGALQLTTNAGSQVGTIYNSLALPTGNGLDVTWDSYQYEGTSPKGADGISFDLAAVNPSDPIPPTVVGPSGGSLGYSTISADTPNGVPFGYLGFGADVFGNFENGNFGSSSCNQSTSAISQSMGVRGPGDGGTGYCLLGQVNLSGASTLDDESATSPTGLAVPEEVVINSGSSAVTASASGISVPAGDYLFATEPLVSDAAGTVWHSIEGALPTNPVDVQSSWLNAAGLPKELAFGWASSTGGDNEYHAINLLTASSLTPAPTLALTNTDSGSLSVGTGATVTLTASVASGSAASESDAPVVSDTFPTSVTVGTATGTNWSCTTAGQLVSCTYTGALPLTAGTALPAISVPITPTAPGPFSNTAAVSSADAAPATTQDIGSIGLTPQTITFTNTPPTSPLPGSSYTVTATGGASGNPVTFSVDNASTSGCSVNSSTGFVTLTLPAGTCVIDANQLGNGAYAAATVVQQTVNTIPGTQTINFTNAPPTSPLAGTTYTVTATGGASGNPVTFSVDHTSASGCTVNSSTGLVTLTAPAGTCVIDANQAGNGVYSAAAQVQQNVASRNPAPQVITFTNTPPASPTIGATYTVSATGGGSGNPVSFSVDPSSTSGCTLNQASGLVTLSAPAGTCVIDANQLGNTNFAPASRVSQTVTSVVPAGDPIAAITSPASGRFYRVGEKIVTTYKCTDPNGPGIAKCSDGRAANGKGRLLTSSLGEYSYVVTATSIDGRTTTTRIRYKVVPRSVSLTIYFPNNSWILSSTATDQLNRFASAVARDGYSKVVVNGYASSTGAGANNLHLGVQRARVAWSYLQSRLSTLSTSTVDARLHGLGATHFKVTPTSAALNRRTVLMAK